MRFKIAVFAVTIFSLLSLFAFAPRSSAQSSVAGPELAAAAAVPDAPLPQAAAQNSAQTSAQTSANSNSPTSQSRSEASPNQNGKPAATTAEPSAPQAHKPLPQPKRILGIMPNYRAVSAGVRPPPPTPREAFKIASENSFDYSSYVFVGVTSLLAEGDDSHPQLGKGVGGFWAYYWRGFVDKTDGNYWVIAILPSVFHEDERYYSLGEGSLLKRGVYAASRVLITPNYQGRNGFNASEILGRGISQGISLTYYPSATRTVSGFSEKYAYALGRDALTNTFREFWPDINAHLIHHHRQAAQ